jgi:hypothetical protein
LLDSASANANSCQGTSALNAKTGYGNPSEGMRPNRPKKMLKTTIVSTGCRMAQATPSAVCL